MNNVFAFDPVVAAVATGIQVSGIIMGAETGTKKSDTMDLDEKQKKIQQGVHKFFVGMVMITFPLQWHFGCPAYISACWALNTLVTLSFSKYITANSEKFGLDIAKEEIRQLIYSKPHAFDWFIIVDSHYLN